MEPERAMARSARLEGGGRTTKLTSAVGVEGRVSLASLSASPRLAREDSMAAPAGTSSSGCGAMRTE